ncbi:MULTISPECIES: hypothetical protein [Nguyenibacter]|uniref:Uncharacterized protein n=1 Tax=Nguyenibacter vanlangensis TaxID=1216886 RepID=A0A7Y7M804_9PROT|nr:MULTISPECIES: hypothetical protein [Nguyenibacter]NVN12504.1 hypothetical protein [Nguyenibacter vanlangensis]WRH87464.1 hypothetical protein QN315_16065 [Nguyenibacter sp. L1]
MSLQPVASSIAQCPLCHRPVRGTVEACPHCGAERHFGPTWRESLTCVAIGLAIGPAAIMLAGAGWRMAALAGAIGVMLGFFVAHSRHAGDRWMPPRS